MGGYRALTYKEFWKVVGAFEGVYARRNRILFSLCCQFRTFPNIVRQLRREGIDYILVHFDLSTRLRADLRALLDHLRTHEGLGRARDFVFVSRKGVCRPISLRCVRQIFDGAFRRAGLNGKLGLPTTRRTYSEVFLPLQQRRLTTGAKRAPQ